jgi:pSer/pThr/pTyr-binding forkhead associated (FHA) protein
MMAVQARLVVVGGDVKTSEIKLRLPCTIGRGRGSAIVLAHPLVSRQHCEIYEAEGALMVRDLGSLNGTFINNLRISETAPLPPNELLTVGTVTFRAVYEPAAETATADEAPAQSQPGEDTVYSGRGSAGGTGTVPFPFPQKPSDESDRATVPASQSSMEALPPIAQLPAADPASLLAPKSEPSPAAQPIEAEPEAEADADADAPSDAEHTPGGSSDDDLQDFLKSLGKK